MKAALSEVTPIVAMVIIGIILITCIVNNLNHGIIYAGISVVSGLGGYTLGKFRAEKVQKDKDQSTKVDKSNLH